MASAYKCDRCGRYYTDSTSATGPVFKKHKDGRVSDLCENCKASLARWFAKYVKEEWKTDDEKYIESFIKHRAFTLGSTGTEPYMPASQFLEALGKFFDYKEYNEEVEDFISKNTPMPNIIKIQDVKKCLEKYFKHEWKGEFYE